VPRYQASQDIFNVFDKVLVLQKEDDPYAPSQMVYFGSTDHDALEEFFSSVGFFKPDEYTWPDCTWTVAPTDRAHTSLISNSVLHLHGGPF
jgi:hypothetical protein